MRVAFAHTAVLAMMVVVLSGCRSSGGNSGWNWGRKNASVDSSSTPMSGPELPSANAAPSGPAGGYDYNAAPQGGDPLYNDQSAANPYPAAPQGGAPGYDHVYAGPPNANGYGAPPNAGGAYGAAPSAAGAYGAMPNAAANAAVPQAGAYDESYGQPPANAYGAAGSPQGYPPPQSNSYQPGSINPAGGGASPPATDPLAAGAPAAGGYAPPSDSYANTAPSAGAVPANPASRYDTADNRNAYGAGASAAQPEQGAADRYSAAAGGVDGTNVADAGAASGKYQPGNTGYQPGATGYSPPGVPPYETPSAANVIATPKGDPYYRPGSTSDYLPRGNSQSPATESTDRYGAPAGNSTAWPSGY